MIESDGVNVDYEAGLEDGFKAYIEGKAWMPIETAPKDGTRILVVDNAILDGFHQVVFWDDEGARRVQLEHDGRGRHSTATLSRIGSHSTRRPTPSDPDR